MGLFAFLEIVVLVVVICAAALWVIGQLAPSHPAIIDRAVWVLAVIILAIILIQAMGLLTHDVPIPRVR